LCRADGLHGDDGNDTLYGHNGKGKPVTGDGNDSFWGEGGNDELYGQEGNDYLDPGSGDDTLNGGNGTNKVAYIGLSESVTVDLQAGEANSGSKTDDLHEIEDVGGTNRGDTIAGSSGDNVIKGHGEDDLLDGREGTDTAQFAGDRANWTPPKTRAPSGR
jgi:Ca2+-binding RTX toxin-like protein